MRYSAQAFSGMHAGIRSTWEGKFTPKHDVSSRTVAVRTNPLHEQVTRQIAAQIVSRRFRPGDLLPSEPELCQEYGVSRTVVREAIRVLASKGLIIVRHGLGSHVNRPEAWKTLDPWLLGIMRDNGMLHEIIDQLIEVRRIFEIEVTGLAAERATADDLAAMQESLDWMAAAADPEAFHDADLHFHAAVARASRNTFLISMMESLAAARGVGLEMSAGARTRECSLAIHQNLLDAVQRHDPASARAAAGELLALAERYMRQQGQAEGHS